MEDVVEYLCLLLGLSLAQEKAIAEQRVYVDLIGPSLSVSVLKSLAQEHLGKLTLPLLQLIPSRRREHISQRLKCHEILPAARLISLLNTSLEGLDMDTGKWQSEFKSFVYVFAFNFSGWQVLQL